MILLVSDNDASQRKISLVEFANTRRVDDQPILAPKVLTPSCGSRSVPQTLSPRHHAVHISLKNYLSRSPF